MEQKNSQLEHKIHKAFGIWSFKLGDDFGGFIRDSINSFGSWNCSCNLGIFLN